MHEWKCKINKQFIKGGYNSCIVMRSLSDFCERIWEKIIPQFIPRHQKQKHAPASWVDISSCDKTPFLTWQKTAYLTCKHIKNPIFTPGFVLSWFYRGFHVLVALPDTRRRRSRQLAVNEAPLRAAQLRKKKASGDRKWEKIERNANELLIMQSLKVNEKKKKAQQLPETMSWLRGIIDRPRLQ